MIAPEIMTLRSLNATRRYSPQVSVMSPIHT